MSSTSTSPVCELASIYASWIASAHHSHPTPPLFSSTSCCWLLPLLIIVTFNSLVLPHKSLHKLQLVQDSAARIISRTPVLTNHITSALQQLHWLPVHYRIDFEDSSFIHLLHNSFTPLPLPTRLDLIPRFTETGCRTFSRSHQTPETLTAFPLLNHVLKPIFLVFYELSLEPCYFTS